MRLIISLTIIQTLVQANILFAQLDQNSAIVHEPDTLKIIKLTLSDNSILFGQILAESDTLIEFRSFAGLFIKFKPELIKEREYLKGETIDGKYIRYDPSNSRLFFFPTARTPNASQCIIVPRKDPIRYMTATIPRRTTIFCIIGRRV